MLNEANGPLWSDWIILGVANATYVEKWRVRKEIVDAV